MFGLSGAAIGGIAAGVGAIGGALISADAAGDAADSQAQGTANSIAEQRRQFDLTREDYAPYREAGKNALTQLVAQSGKTPTAAEIMSDPGYQFGLQQGQLGLDRKAAAMGGRVSGAALKAASRYNTDYASTGYGAAYQRGQDRLNRLAAIAGIGQTATNSSAAAGTSAANAISSALSSQGDATAASQVAQGNIWGNTANQIAALYGRSYGTSLNSGNSYTGIGGGTYANWDLSGTNRGSGD